MHLNKTNLSTPLHLAVKRNDVNIVRLILSNGNAQVDIKDDQGKKPIDYATNDQIIQMLNH